MGKEKYIIFQLNNPDNNYKGILFAEIDDDAIAKESGFPPMPKDYIIGVMAIIWTDKEGEWHSKVRLKYPGGAKQIFENNFGKDCNETLILTDLYKFPMKHKIWTKNSDGTGEGIMKIIEELDMIESIEIRTD